MSSTPLVVLQTPFLFSLSLPPMPPSVLFRLPQVVAFAECCQRRLARAVENKERICRPVFTEVRTIVPCGPVGWDEMEVD